MASQGKRRLLPVGVHVALEGAHLIQFEQAGDRMVVVARASAAFTRPEDAVRRLVSARREGEEAPEPDCRAAIEFVAKETTTNGFRGKEVVVSLPSEQLVVQHVRLPPMGEDELRTALPFELEGKLPFAPREAVVRHIVAGTVTEEGETKHEVIALAMRREVVQRRLAALERLKLTLVGAGVEPCTMCYPWAWASEHAGPSQSGPPCLMLVHLGWERTDVAILRGQEVAFVKPVAQGVDHVIEAVSMVRDIPLEEAADLVARWRAEPTPEHLDEAVAAYSRCRGCTGHLVDEIQSCIRYHASLARGKGVDRVVFVGPGARDKALVRVLEANLPVPCEVGDPVGTVTGEADPEGPAPELAVAVGLSLFGAN